MNSIANIGRYLHIHSYMYQWWFGVEVVVVMVKWKRKNRNIMLISNNTMQFKNIKDCNNIPYEKKKQNKQPFTALKVWQCEKNYL